MSVLTAMTTAYSLAEAFGATDCTTAAMKAAIKEWFDLFYQTEKTKEEDPCQRIPYTVVNKLTKTAFGEYKASSKDAFAQAVLDALDKRKSDAMQDALKGGEAYLKPFPVGDHIAIGVIARNNIQIFGKDSEGRPTDVGTTESVKEGKRYYTLLERRTLENGYLTIRNKLYQSEQPGDLGRRVPLNTLPRYAELLDEYTYSEPIGLGIVRMSTPLSNCVDGSRDSVSVYAPAVGLIHNINRNEAQINGEFERGQSRIIVSADMTRRDKVTGDLRFDDDIFVGLDESQEDLGVTIFSPALREASFLARKTEYLRNVESLIGLKRGLLSEVEAAERTAKEVTSSEGDYNLTIIDFQKMWENAVKETVVLCGKLGRLYNVPGAHDLVEDDVALDFGNGVLYDEDKTWEDYKGMVAAGMLKPEIALGWRFNMPTETPEDLAKIREKYMPESVADGDE